MKLLIGFISSTLAVPIPPNMTSAGVPILPILPIDYLLEDLAMKHDGCCDSCGYTKCPSTNLCVRPSETYCKEFDFPYNILYQTAGIIIPPKKENKIK